MEYVAHVAVVFLLYAILGVSLNILLGYTGLMSMAHAAFYGIGAYTSALVLLNTGAPFLVAAAAGILVAAILGAIVAIPALRIRDEYLVMLTLAFQMVFTGLLVSVEGLTRGTTGLAAIPRPTIMTFVLSKPSVYVVLVLVAFIIAFAVAWRLTHSPFGRVLRSIREDDRVSLSFGKPVTRFKVLAFVMAGGIAAIAGALFASYTTFIVPRYFDADVSIFLIAIVAVGGTGNLIGSVAGAFILITLPEILTFLGGSYDLVNAVRAAAYGGLLVLMMRFRPQGIIPEHAVLFGRRESLPPSISVDKAKQTISDRVAQRWADESLGHPAIVEIRSLAKSFGGLKAVQGVSLGLERGKITALIGPNGAGKTTLFNLVTSFIKPDHGEVYFDGRPITGMPAYAIANLGLVRSFQGKGILDGMRVIDNVMVARPNQSGEKLLPLFFRPGRVAREESANLTFAMACLAFVGLGERGNDIAGELSYAEQKMLQIACLLATEAQVLLLDEPVSGVDPAWVGRVLDLIKELAQGGKTICIIEHNLDVVRTLAVVSHFLSEGQVISSGPTHELVADPKLVEMYFGAMEAL